MSYRSFKKAPHQQGSTLRPAKRDSQRTKMNIATILNEAGKPDAQPSTTRTVAHRPRRPSKHASTSDKVRDAMKLSRVLNSIQSPGTVASSQGAGRAKAHGPRPKYYLEETLAMWYLRTDMGLQWDSVEEHYNRWFPERSRAKPGLQCKFYRVIESWGVARVRAQTQCLPAAKSNATDNDLDTAAYGVIERTDHVFPWMLPEHRRRQVRTGSNARLLPPFPEKHAKEQKQSTTRKASRL